MRKDPEPKGACEHLSQITFLLYSKPSMAPTILKTEAQFHKLPFQS